MILLYSVTMVLFGAYFGGLFYKRRFDKEIAEVKSEAQKLADAAYHKGFEQGIEKAHSDIVATVSAHQNAEIQEEVKLAKLAEEIGLEASMEEHAHGPDCDHSDTTYSITLKPKKARKKPSKKKPRKSKK